MVKNMFKHDYMNKILNVKMLIKMEMIAVGSLARFAATTAAVFSHSPCPESLNFANNEHAFLRFTVFDSISSITVANCDRNGVFVVCSRE